MYDRRSAGRTLTFDFGEGLVDDNLLVVDRETDSIWSQLDGKAIAGPLSGTPMRVVPALQTSWKHWTTLHPETLVLTVPGIEGRTYRYSDLRGPLGLGLSFGEVALFAPIDHLARVPEDRKVRLRPSDVPTPLVSLGGQAALLHVLPEARTAWAVDLEGDLLPGVLAYQSGWLAFHPDSSILLADGTHMQPDAESGDSSSGSNPPPQVAPREGADEVRGEHD